MADGSTTTGRRKPRAKRDVTINVRASAETRDLIDRAAAAAGRSRTDFILESARTKAADVLMDQTLFVLDERKYAAFMRILDNPPPPNAKLRALLADKAPWEA